MLKKGIQFLLGRKNVNLASVYPNAVPINQIDFSSESRLGWCYGDLGIASTLWKIYKNTGDENLKKEALLTFDKTLPRRANSSSEVKDACFCHGTSGIAHIYNKIYQDTGNIEYKKAALFWLDKTLDWACSHDSISGYKTWFGSTGWTSQANVLEGSSGIGLSLVGFLSKDEPKWDKVFLL